MTEHNTPTTPSETVAERVEPAHQQQEPKPQPSGRSGVLLGSIAIIIALALSGGHYYYTQQQEQQKAAVIQRLESQLSALQQQYNQGQRQWEDAQQSHSQSLNATEQRLNALTRQSDEMSQKLASLTEHDTNTWLLSQADFLVKMAGRKLWSDKDVTTAGALLKSADASLAEMNDPSVIEVRRALTNDISALAGVSQIDFDGIILKVNQLTDQVDNLRLADNNSDETPMDENSTELSASLSEWRQNLSKSWHNFIAEFITVRRRDSAAEPLLAPNQDIYLRENIRSRLLVAAQAIPRHQNETYRQSLETAATWVRAYFDTSDPNTQAFLESVDALSQQSVSMDVPTTLQSQPLLEKLMQTRVRNLLAQTPATRQEG
ncbi:MULTISPECIES: uroporphyrinogen-III C-methyltransferase [unclassified Brenneria]|uniref:uroporphyrinogen-III C-methyltransferase n=1 Tax=unclassified Brenneria TaxID=2634434 RepID=UPI0029C53876|nr:MULTISPECIES: uroporphyrinogen-III C-methyltransferase [unclassified Brenneria]MDX5630163.1 uroporphyrinogen-III C-methyltransferase [Brenneria sp. L3-3Z]MDX5697229.1 uroporphyrinogen-III C-methyltransferase [Brenneria sp. L4-2C]